MKTTAKICQDSRAVAAMLIGDLLAKNPRQSEAAAAKEIRTGLAAIPEFMPSGWYDPPPGGVAVLFASPEDNYERTRFGSLRAKEYWPQLQRRLSTEGVGILYVSPATRTGIIGDWGATIYHGADAKIRQHIQYCLETVERLAEFTAVGMEFGAISRQADELLRQRQLTSDRTVLVDKSATGTNCGHTVPWTDEPPTAAEHAILVSNDQAAINQLISGKRVLINANSAMVIPKTITITIELRLESPDNPRLPQIFFHLIVSFEDGEKTISSNLNPFFEAVGMDHIRSRY